MSDIEQLAVYQRGVARIGERWDNFQALRHERLRECERFPHAAERAVEAVIEDLMTGVLDWSSGDLNHQVGYADLMLSRLGIKHLIVETKRPGALLRSRTAIEAALAQACRYAGEQKVQSVAVSDGTLLYCADVVAGGLRDRAFCSLSAAQPPTVLWWLSTDGIYRPAPPTAAAELLLAPDGTANADGDRTSASGFGGVESEVLHHKYQLPARCFAYIGDRANPRTWSLPYLLLDGSVDSKRLPGAVRSILSNYRGAHLSKVPEQAIPDVLVRLARAAAVAGRLPSQDPSASATYVSLLAAVQQLGREDEIGLPS
jgi:hypothetical protein